MLNYQNLETLAVVLREGSFQKAAQALRVTQSAVSQRIRVLEDEFGQPLVVRTVPPKPTPAGQQLLSHYDQILALEQGLMARSQTDLRRRETILLNLAVNTESLATWFIDALAPILKQGDARVAIKTADQAETAELLKEGQVLGSVSDRPTAPPGCTSKKLGAMLYRCVCSPGFQKANFTSGLSNPNLQQAPAAIFDETDKLHEQFLRTTAFKSVGTLPYTYVPSPEGLVKFALDGLAYSVLPAVLVDPHIKAGRLIDLFPDHTYKLKLYWHVVDSRVPILEQLTAQILKYAGKSLSQ